MSSHSLYNVYPVSLTQQNWIDSTLLHYSNSLNVFSLLTMLDILCNSYHYRQLNLIALYQMDLILLVELDAINTFKRNKLNRLYRFETCTCIVIGKYYAYYVYVHVKILAHVLWYFDLGVSSSSMICL